MKTLSKNRIGFLLLGIMIVVALMFLFSKVIKKYDFLTDRTCALPCLANITPGVTTAEDALKIASDKKSFGSCNLVDQTKQGGYKFIDCQAYKSKIIISLKNNKADGFGIFPYPDIRVKEIFDKFGYPIGVSCGFVNLPDNPQRVKLTLWIDKYYTTVDLPEISGNTCTVSADSKIKSIGFGSKESYEEGKKAALRLNDFQPWVGFSTYQGVDLP